MSGDIGLGYAIQGEFEGKSVWLSMDKPKSYRWSTVFDCSVDYDSIIDASKTLDKIVDKDVGNRHIVKVMVSLEPVSDDELVKAIRSKALSKLTKAEKSALGLTS